MRLVRRPPLRTTARRTYAAVRSLGARINSAPVILLGNEKSGTTAIAALLGEHTGLSVTLDIPALWGRAVPPILSGERSFESVLRSTRHEFSRDIVKEPTLTWLYPQLRESIPGATYVLIARDPRSNIRSIFNRIGVPGDRSELDSELRASIHRNYRWHFDRPELLGLSGESYVELAAARWNRAVDTYLGHREQIMLVRYEDFVADKIAFLGALADALDLPRRRDVSEDVDKQFQGRGDRAVSWESFFGVRNLSAIERICGDRMALLGYERLLSS